MGARLRQLKLVDIASVAYFTLLSLVILFFHKNLNLWWVYIVIHAFIISALLFVIGLSTRKASKFLHFVRDWYLILLIIFGFEEMNNLVTIIFPYWANPFVINLDKLIFGVYPTVWLERITSPWLTEVMLFFYNIYFLIIPVSGAVLYLKKKRPEFDTLFFNISLAYYVSFVLFLFFPAEGPWVTMTHYQSKELTGYLFFALDKFIQGMGAIKGGCFPSSHVAGAFAAALSLFKFERKTSYWMFLTSCGVALSAIYSRHHHAVDSLAGILIGILAVAAGMKISRWQKKI
jgi:membrane-associated phospholipid phosphatase